MARYKTKTFTEYDINNIINLYDIGYDMNKIRDVTNIALNIIRKYLVMEYDNKIPITKEESNYYRRLYQKGKSLAEIALETGRTVSVIRPYVKDLIAKDEKIKKQKEINKFKEYKSHINIDSVLTMYFNSKYTIYDIAKYYSVSDSDVKNIIQDHINKNCNKINFKYLFELPLDVTKVKLFRDFFCDVGDIYSTTIINSNFEPENIKFTILEKYSNIVTTTYKDFQYRDILLNCKCINRKKK